MNILYSKYQALLEKSGKNTATVCKETGIAETTMSNWKNRGGGLSVENLAKLANYFGVSIEYFLESVDARA